MTRCATGCGNSVGSLLSRSRKCLPRVAPHETSRGPPAADQRIRAAVKQAIHTGARLRDIAAAAGVTIDDIRAIRDESLN